MSETIPAAVTRKLLAVMAEASYIKKDKKNDFHKYNYASEQAIKETLHPILVKHGLLFLPVGCETVSEVEIVTSKGNKERVMTIRYFYRWVDAETGESTDVLHSMGTGTDASDKSVYKGLTGAIKYILTGTFLIPTGDDPEREDGRRKQAEAPRNHAAAQKGPTPAPAKNFEALKFFREIKPEIGEQIYYQILRKHGFKKSDEITDANQARTIYREMGEARKAVVAATHGEVVKGVEEQLFNSLPEASRALVFNELRKKIAVACGSADTAADEFDRLRGECNTQWELYRALDRAHEFYSTGKMAG